MARETNPYSDGLSHRDLVIVTVVHDAADELDRTCRSLEPFVGRFEHLIIDGGSTDDTIDVARRWAAVLGSTVCSEPDRGPYDAMNKALGMIDPDAYVWFVNAGDRIPDNRAVVAVEDWIRSGSGRWCFGAVLMISPERASGYVPRQGDFSTFRYAYSRIHICHQSVIAQCRALVELGGFSSAYPIFADFHLLVRLSRIAQPERLNVILSEYESTGLSSRHPWRNHFEQAAARRDALGLSGLEAVADYAFLAYCLLSFGMKRLVARVRTRSLSRLDRRALQR